MKQALFFLPLCIVAFLGGFFLWGLKDGRDPNAIPSVLISKPVPSFDLPAIPGVDSPGLSQANLEEAGELLLVNMFASWCGPCRAEHPLLTKLGEDQNIPLMGINYKDKADAAAGWLDELGNPYARIGHDLNGRAGIEWGLTGVPETFLIGPDGTILYREAGPVVGDGMTRLLEAIDAAKAGS